MALQPIQVKKRVKGYAGNVIIKYPVINDKIINETTAEGHFNRDIVEKILDSFMEFGYETMNNDRTFRIPYIGSFKVKPWLKEDATIHPE